MNDGQEKRGKLRLKTVITAVAVVMLVFGVLLIVATKLGGLVRDGADDTDETTERELEYHSHTPTAEYTYSIDPGDPFSTIAPLRSYSCIVIVSDSYNDTSTSAYNVTVAGERFCFGNGERTVIFDGKTLYIKSPVYEIRKETGSASLTSELGVVSLDELKDRIGKEDAEVSFSDDGKVLNVSLSDDLVREEYKVDAVNGFITQYTVIRDGIRIKTFSMIDIKPLSDDKINENLFKIPD